jgi:branched-chain amino acid aminotransferase
MHMEGDWQVRVASPEDVGAVAAAVGELLLELGGTPTSMAGMKEAARALTEDEQAGVLLVADADGAIVGVLGASWQMAIHIPGSYGLIQDLWVHPQWRGQAIGASLITALFDLARDMGIDRVEVGLPGDGYTGLSSTEAFYRANGFHSKGPRMRCLL